MSDLIIQLKSAIEERDATIKELKEQIAGYKKSLSLNHRRNFGQSMKIFSQKRSIDALSKKIEDAHDANAGTRVEGGENG